MSAHALDPFAPLVGRGRLFPRAARPAAPKGRGMAPLRDLLVKIALRSESYAWRYDAEPWTRHATDEAMFEGDVRALESFGIGTDHRIEQTDSPVRFLITAPDGTCRTLELLWDSISYDILSMPPHVKAFSGGVSALILLAMCAACWISVALAVRAFGLIG